jgi:ribosome-associated protein
VLARLPIDGAAIAFGYTCIWVTTPEHQLVKVDLRTNRVVSEVGPAADDNDFDDDIVIGYGSLWVAIDDDAVLLRIGPQTDKVIRWYQLPESCQEVSFGAGSIWVSLYEHSEVYRIDPTPECAARAPCATLVIVQQIEVGEAGIRLGQLLKLAGLVDSGGEVKVVLAEGKVTVNGNVETRRGAQLRPGDVVHLPGATVQLG